MRWTHALLFTAACGGSTPVTPSGTVLFEWELSKASRLDVRKAAVGTRVVRDFKVTFTQGEAPFVVDVRVEAAPIDYDEEGAKVHQESPVAIKASVKDNPAWELSGSCQDGPHYQMPAAAPDGGLVTPMGMIQSCMVKYHRKAGTIFTSEWDLGTTLSAYGDGSLEAFPADDAKIE
jgi:hypothetical protein